MAKAIKLADIATQAGVSVATVSRVLNGKSVVADSTRHAVLSALDLLGYERPEKLREKKSGLVGLIVPELSNPIFPRFAQFVENALVPQGYLPMLATQMAGGATEDAYVDAMLEEHVSGIVFISGLHADSTANVERYQKITARGVPFVTINGANPLLSAPDFSTDDAFAITRSVRHLAALGHTRIGLAIGPTRFYPAAAKVGAYERAMEQILPDSQLHEAVTLFTVEGGQAAAAQLIEQGCTGIICGSDIMALGVIRYCELNSLNVPRDISVIGFDDSPIMSFTNPPLTTVRQPVKEITSAAVNTLISLIKGSDSFMGSMSFTPELVVRESTAAAAA